MKVICAGLMKTGTKSLAKALRKLGFSVYDVEEHVSFHLQPWCEILDEAKEPDFRSMYRDVDTVTDVPANIFYEEILKAFPDAKVILSERDSEDVWLASWINHLEMKLRMEREPLRVLLFALSSSYRKAWKIVLRSHQFILGFPNVNVNESKFLLKKKYREHNERVKAVVPPDQLLVYNVKQGWKPICKFLGRDIPTCPFPHANIGGSTVKKNHAIQHLLGLPNIAREAIISLSLLVLVLAVMVSFVGSEHNSLIEPIESIETKCCDCVVGYVCTFRMISYCSNRGQDLWW